MKKKIVNIVITDLDDTIWDWFTMWEKSFKTYLDNLSIKFNVDKDTLISDFKTIHTKYASSETSFIYRELNCLNDEQKDLIDLPIENKKSILHEYYSSKKNNLFLYDGVLDTLKKLKELGVLIIGFTESNAFFTKYRIKHLELDGLIDFIYAPIDSGVPQSVYRHYSEEFWVPEITEFRYLSKDTKKPAPDILEIILKDFNANKNEAIYIGDKLDKDIAMANILGVDSVHARYGYKIDSDGYELLRKVSHWTISDINKEKETDNKPIPDYILKENFCELMDYFEFRTFDPKLNPKNIDNIIKIWEKSIDVQQHFNEIELKIRNYALTVLTFIIGGIGYVENQFICFNYNGMIIPGSALIALIGIVIISAFWYMDNLWYHKFLVGAVKHSLNIERLWRKKIPEIGLSTSIGNESPHKFLWIKKILIHSKHKFIIFYGLIIVTLLAIMIGLFMFYNV